MQYPEYAEIDGKEYKIDTDFEVALRCFEILQDNTITEYEQSLAICYLLFDVVPEDKNLNEFLKKAQYYLQCGETTEQQQSKEKDMDFFQDRKYINSSIMATYHVDLSKQKVHFWQFIEWIEGLPEESTLNRIRLIRTKDLNEISDTKEKNRIKELQKTFALKKEEKKFTKQEEKNMEEFYKLMETEVK